MIAWLRYISIPSTYLLILIYSISDGVLAKLFISSIFGGTLLLIVTLMLRDRRLLSRYKGNLTNYKYLTSLLLLLSLFLVSILREIMVGEALPAAFRLLLLLYTIAVCAYYLGRCGSNERFRRFILSFSWMLFIPVVINFFLHLAGVTGFSLVTQPATMLEGIGIHIDRVRFFLSYGSNSYAPIAAMSFLAAYFLVLGNRNPVKKTLYGLICFVSFCSILLVDSRGSLVIVILIAFAFTTLKLKRQVLYLLVLCSPLFAILLLLVDLTSLNIYARGQTEIATLTNRVFYWIAITDYLASFNLGQILGGNLFFQPPNFEIFSIDNDFGMNQIYFTLHNSILQMLMQIGYVGVVLYILMLRKLARILSISASVMNNDISARLVTTNILFVLTIGNIETVFTPSVFVFPAAIFLFIAMSHKYMSANNHRK